MTQKTKALKSQTYWRHQLYISLQQRLPTFYGGIGTQARGASHLQDAHAVGVSQDLVCLVVVTIADVGRSDEEFKRVVLIQIQRASLDLLLQLPHALLPIAGFRQF